MVWARTTNKHGFTLIELSIVLVIIGLIVGGLMAGRELIVAAKIRKDISTILGIQSAVHAFKNKYNCLPGDCTNASNFFGVIYATPGNGDGMIGKLVPDRVAPGIGCRDYYTDNSSNGEGFEITGAMDQLARAGLIALTPFDVTDNASAAWAGKGWPASAVNGAFGVNIASCEGSNFLVWGVRHSDVNAVDFYAGNPAGAFAIDSKLDDGIPNAGKIRARFALNHPTYSLVSVYTPTPCLYDDGERYLINENYATGICPLRIDAGF